MTHPTSLIISEPRYSILRRICNHIEELNWSILDQYYLKTGQINQKKETLNSRGMVTIPYVKGLSEAFSRILKTYRICAAVRPHTVLRSMLVHPKDKISDEEKPEVVYKIPCKNCERVYVGETGRPLAARVKEHRKEVDSITGIFIRTVCNKSAITDHACNENHVIDWENAKVIDRESVKAGRHIREAIWIRKT